MKQSLTDTHVSASRQPCLSSTQSMGWQLRHSVNNSYRRHAGGSGVFHLHRRNMYLSLTLSLTLPTKPDTNPNSNPTRSLH